MEKRQQLRVDFLELKENTVIHCDILFLFQFFNIITNRATLYFQENREVTNLRLNISKFK